MANHDGEPLVFRGGNGLQLFISCKREAWMRRHSGARPAPETRQKGHMRTQQRSISALGSQGDFTSGGTERRPGRSIANNAQLQTTANCDVSKVLDGGQQFRLFGPWKPAFFIPLVILVILISRSAVILTSHDDAQMDLSIYQEVGELLVHGIDPYDYRTNVEARTALRLNDYGAAEWVKQSAAMYDYYVSSNLPGSTALYGLLERISQGNPKVWRLAFASGDIFIALAAFLLLHRAGVVLDTVSKQITFSLAAIYYPSNIEWGLLIAEDKQIQTALMLLLAGLLVARPVARGPLNAAAIGSIGALSVIFKAFGVFLAPVALSYFYRAPRRELVLAFCAAAITVLPFILLFDLSFVHLILDRVAHGSGIEQGIAWLSLATHPLPGRLLCAPSALRGAEPVCCDRLRQRTAGCAELFRGDRRDRRLPLDGRRQHGPHEHRDDVRHVLRGHGFHQVLEDTGAVQLHGPDPHLYHGDRANAVAGFRQCRNA
jgi:hypothetical protein